VRMRSRAVALSVSLAIAASGAGAAPGTAQSSSDDRVSSELAEDTGTSGDSQDGCDETQASGKGRSAAELHNRDPGVD
jgi:hypothetical protein